MKNVKRDFIITVLFVFVCWILSAWMLSKPENPAPEKAIRAKESYRYNDIHQILAPNDTARVDSTNIF